MLCHEIWVIIQKVKINPIYILLKGRTNISKGRDETSPQNEAKAQRWQQKAI